MGGMMGGGGKGNQGLETLLSRRFFSISVSFFFLKKLCKF